MWLLNEKILTLDPYHNIYLGVDQYVQPATTNFNQHTTHHVLPSADQYGIHDSVLGHQPITNHYEVKRENQKQTLPATVGNDNPFLRNRAPKSVRVQLKRLDSLQSKKSDDGSEGWIPIPYPIYRK